MTLMRAVVVSTSTDPACPYAMNKSNVYQPHVDGNQENGANVSRNFSSANFLFSFSSGAIGSTVSLSASG
jgi:hypothetical protein